jgi:hypothetical protein
MSAEEATAALARLAAVDLDPALDAGEVEAIIAAAKRPDAEGREIIDDEWVETYDVRAAAVEAWETKAGKAAGRADIARGGSSVKRSSVHEACLRMARLYRRGTSSAVIGRAQPVLDDLPLANGPDEPPELLGIGYTGPAGGTGQGDYSW